MTTSDRLRRWLGIGALWLCASVAQAQTPVFDVPRLADIAIDGKADDWKGDGLMVDALAPVTEGWRTAANFTASLRLGWNEKGIVALVTVRDDVATESKNPKALWQKDSVELFWGEKQGVRHWVQAHIAPGRDPETPQVRVHIEDHRETGAAGRPVTIQAASGKTADGYLLEALLPWDCLGIDPKQGREAAFQIAVNDADGDAPRAQSLWFPEGGAYSDPTKMQRIRLSNKPSPAIAVAAVPDYTAFPRTRLSLSAARTLAGRRVTASDRSGTLGEVTLTNGVDGRATGSLILRRVPEGPVTLNPGGPLALRDAETLRKEALDRAPLKFDAYVFDSPGFPAVDFANPERVESIIGEYALRVDYYDAGMNPVTSAETPGRYGAVVSVVSKDGKLRAKRYVTLARVASVPDWDTWGKGFALPLPKELGIDPNVVREQNLNIEEFLKSGFYESLATMPYAAVFMAGMLEARPGDPPVARLSAEQRDRKWWFGLKTRRGEARPYRYLVGMPKGYDADARRKWPVLLFLHGSGERGEDLTVAGVHGPLKYLREGHDLPFIVINPQCELGDYWLPARVMALLDEVKRKYRVDESRLYLTGLSMGGFGTWATATEYPERFAAIAPICGGGDPADAARLTKVPVWNFHGARDSVVPITLSQEMIDALKKAGAAEVEFTVYPEAEHDSWTDTYNNPKLYEWFLTHQK
ncbi:MAG: sugar-binding protein [Capsulimonadales bacterium]|nr:sugar-binding protein [Capsulimonadales bacterium]